MKKAIVGMIVLCCAMSLGMAQDADRSPSEIGIRSTPRGPGQSPGQCSFSMDVEAITGDIRCLGVEYTENWPDPHYFVTGAADMVRAWLYEIDRKGNLVKKMPQPKANWGTWGWRDLAYDGTFLYAGDDGNAPGYITQIDPATGQPTGVYYGPFPVTPCRAMAYDSALDCFWTASWGSDLYQCFRDNTYLAHSNPGLSVYGMAMDEAVPGSPVLWIWSQDGNGSLATGLDLNTGGMVSFDGCPEIGGVAGGACAYPTCNGEWELMGLHQASPDTIMAYCIADPCPLMDDTCAVYVANGGAVNFQLDAGPLYGNKQYLLLGTLSGVYPGTPIPWTSCPLRINWDFFTQLNVLFLNTPSFFNFLGVLDPAGKATAQFSLPPNSGMPPDLRLHFAYVLGPGNDFVSNPVEIWTRP